MPFALPRFLMKILILLALFALNVAHVSATDPVKCPGQDACADIKAGVEPAKKSAKSSRLLQPRYRPATSYTYSDVPLRPAPGMTAWKPAPKKPEAVIARKSIERPVEPPPSIRKTVSVETASVKVDEEQLMDEMRPSPKSMEMSAALPLPAL
jgi:hypothetical protein